WTARVAPSREFSARGATGAGRGRSPKSRGTKKQGRGSQDAGRQIGVVGVASMVGGTMIYLSCQDKAPYTNRSRFMIVDRDGEFLKRMGASTWAEVKKQYGPRILPKTHQASRTVERIGKRIADASGLEGCNWEFIVVKDDNMNAFALPGGKVVVFTGLFEVTPNSDALASVLGHEVGHVVANHGGEKVSKGFLKEALLLMLVVVTGYDYFDAARSIGSLVFDLPNSREMEREADYIGMQLTAKACFDPQEMPETFARMNATAKKKRIMKGPAYLSTHPADEERIAKQREWMDSALQTRERSGCSDLQQWGAAGNHRNQRW
ncbi:unnamed protein product, partial [Ascophyllum nodosum]